MGDAVLRKLEEHNKHMTRIFAVMNKRLIKLEHGQAVLTADVSHIKHIQLKTNALLESNNSKLEQILELIRIPMEGPT